jgi:outer membrane protein assembly factor BamB
MSTFDPTYSGWTRFVVGLGLAGALALPAAANSSGEITEFRMNQANNAVVAGDVRATWTFETGGPISASPTVVDGVLYIGNNTGRLVALDVRTGKLLWSQQAKNDLMAEPLVVGNLVIVGEGNETTDVRSGVVHVGLEGENAILAFDRSTGKPVWSVPVGGTAMPTPALVDGLIVEHNGSGDIMGIDPATGTVKYDRFTGTIPSMVGLMPVGKFAVLSGGQTRSSVVALNVTDGTTIWERQFPKASGLGDCPLAGDGQLAFCDYVALIPPEDYVQAGKLNTLHAFALDQITGDVVWDTALEAGILPKRNQSAIPLYDSGMVFLGSAIAPYMHALDSQTGKLIWRTKVRGPVKNGPVAVQGVVYFGDLGGFLWALDEKTGKVLGVKHVKTKFNVGSAIVVGKTLIIGSQTGRIVALPLDAIKGAHDKAAPKTVAKGTPAG